MIKKIFIYIVLIILTASCKDFRNEGPQNAFKKDLARASPDFQQGWSDGCEVGRATGDDTFYRMFVSNNKVDGWKMAQSQDYKVAWSYGFWYCYRDDHIDQKSTPFKSFFGGFQ